MNTVYLTDSDMLALVRILNNSLDNTDLFTEVDEDGYEKFNNEFFKQIKSLAKILENQSQFMAKG
jgi:hypothetical protein